MKRLALCCDFDYVNNVYINRKVMTNSDQVGYTPNRWRGNGGRLVSMTTMLTALGC